MSDLTKVDCFAYLNEAGRHSCYGLKKLYCKETGKCPFYRTDLHKSKIEKDIFVYEKGTKKVKEYGC